MGHCLQAASLEFKAALTDLDCAFYISCAGGLEMQKGGGVYLFCSSGKWGVLDFSWGSNQVYLLERRTSWSCMERLRSVGRGNGHVNDL